MDFEKKRKKKQQANIVCCVQVYGVKGLGGGECIGIRLEIVVVINTMWVFVQTSKAKEHVFMSHDVQYVNESHLWCGRGGPERMWARRQQIPWVHKLRVDEDAVERAPAPTGLWEDTLTMQIQKLRTRGRWDDTNQTVNSPFRGGGRQTGTHIASPNLSAVVFPMGKEYHTLFMLALCNMNSINIALITNTVWPTSSV